MNLNEFYNITRQYTIELDTAQYKEDTMNTETTTAFAPVPALRELTAEEWALLAAKPETEESFVTTDEETEATEETPTLH